MKNYKVNILPIFFLLLASCVSSQEIRSTRIYSENEVDRKPIFPGGTSAMKDFVKKKLVWPDEFGNKGYVIFSAVITKNGKITDVKIKRTLCEFCDIAALEVLNKMPRWLPGLIKEKPVCTRVLIPIRFEIIE